MCRSARLPDHRRGAGRAPLVSIPVLLNMSEGGSVGTFGFVPTLDVSIPVLRNVSFGVSPVEEFLSRTVQAVSIPVLLNVSFGEPRERRRIAHARCQRAVESQFLFC